jgi:hypothetical protein
MRCLILAFLALSCATPMTEEQRASAWRHAVEQKNTPGFIGPVQCEDATDRLWCYGMSYGQRITFSCNGAGCFGFMN